MPHGSRLRQGQRNDPSRGNRGMDVGVDPATARPGPALGAAALKTDHPSRTAGCGLRRAGCWRLPRIASRHLDLACMVAMLIAMLPSPVAAQDNLPRLRLVEDLRLDADAEDFSLLSRVLVDSNAGIAMPLPQDMETRIYDATGRRLAAVGVRGGGPGEL